MANASRSITTLLIDRLSGASTAATTKPEPPTPTKQLLYSAKGEANSQDLCLYYLQLIRSIVQYSPSNMWPALEGFFASDGTKSVETLHGF